AVALRHRQGRSSSHSLRALHLDSVYGQPPKNGGWNETKTTDPPLYRGSPTQIRVVTCARSQPSRRNRVLSGTDALARHCRIRRAPVGGYEAVANQPVIADGHEDIAVAAVVVEADLGEDGEVAGDPRFLRIHVGEADVRDI